MAIDGCPLALRKRGESKHHIQGGAGEERETVRQADGPFSPKPYHVDMVLTSLSTVLKDHTL